MTSDPTAEQLAELDLTGKAATPRPWVRVTEGNASVEQLAHKLLHDLSVPLAEGIPANTDATYVLTADGSKNVAFIGNGPKQTDNGDFIVAAANLAEPLARDVSQLRDRVAELTEALDRAELVCILYGWTGAADQTERGKALHELWAEWYRAHGEYTPKDYPQLNDERIAELARRRDATTARTLAAFEAEVAAYRRAALPEIPS